MRDSLDKTKQKFPHLKSALWDVSGAFGDIGVLFPLAIALIAKNGFNPTALFLMAGIFYIASAYYFKITMPVQPLKAMSAIAIASGINSSTISSAGIVMGAILAVIAFTGLGVRIGRIFPVSVIRGIQLGLGIMLIKASAVLSGDDIFIAIVAGIVLISCLWAIKKVPPLIPIMILGIALSLKEIKMTSLGPVAVSITLPEPWQLWIGFTTLVLPQIALTFGNAIVATEATGKLLYGKRAEKLNLKSIPMSMSIANIVSGIIGGVPMCHGCGGLTAHHKFGSTNERSGYIIGFTLIALALLFGHAALSIISAFPKGILGILLFYVGIQHSLFVRNIRSDKAALFIAFSTAVSGFVLNNLTIGFLIGLGIHYFLLSMMKTLNALK
ncbi:MAG: putative sulfate/molybdate transporter [Thermodesulfovibrionales bacterium]|nr:putative sulfate/molybdate transporter [Thermodesulfovibrionales bacterium]